MAWASHRSRPRPAVAQPGAGGRLDLGRPDHRGGGAVGGSGGQGYRRAQCVSRRGTSAGYGGALPLQTTPPKAGRPLETDTWRSAGAWRDDRRLGGRPWVSGIRGATRRDGLQRLMDFGGGEPPSSVPHMAGERGSQPRRASRRGGTRVLFYPLSSGATCSPVWPPSSSGGPRRSRRRPMPDFGGRARAETTPGRCRHWWSFYTCMRSRHLRSLGTSRRHAAVPVHFWPARDTRPELVPKGVVGIMGPWNYPFTDDGARHRCHRGGQPHRRETLRPRAALQPR